VTAAPTPVVPLCPPPLEPLHCTHSNPAARQIPTPPAPHVLPQPTVLHPPSANKAALDRSPHSAACPLQPRPQPLPRLRFQPTIHTPAILLVHSPLCFLRTGPLHSCLVFLL